MMMKHQLAVWMAMGALWLPSARAAIVVDVADPAGGAEAGNGIAVPTPAGAGAAAGESAEVEDVLEFVNRDRLHGKLLAVKPGDAGVRWKSANSPRDIEFGTASVDQIKLAAGKPGGSGSAVALVRLTNDDLLAGKIVSMDANRLVLDTAYAGRLDVRRSMIQSMNPNSGHSPLVYEGPNSLEEWMSAQRNNRQPPGWTFKNGVLYALRSSAPLGRSIDKLPAVVNIEVEIGWYQYPELTMTFLTDNLQNYYGGNCYMLQFSGSSLQMYRYMPGSGQTSLGSAEIRRLRNSKTRRCKINLLVDKSKRQIALLMDDALVQQWTDPNEFTGTGKGLLFYPQNQGNLKIYAIRVSEWDGKMPQARTSGGGEKTDTVRFANGDAISGVLKSIEQERAKFETSYAVMDIPVERIGEVVMASATAERARRFENDVQATFAETGTITVRLDSLENGQVKGFSENFGNVTMPMNVFKLLRFNLYRTPEEKSEDPDGPPTGDEDGE